MKAFVRLLLVVCAVFGVALIGFTAYAAKNKKSRSQSVSRASTDLSATSASSPTSTPPPGTPRFFTYQSPAGVADSAGEPSVGSNWTKEATNHNTNVGGLTNNIPNGGTSLYFGGFLPAMAKVTWDDCSSPAGALWENKPLISASTPRAAGDPILFTDHDTGRTFCGQLEGLTPAGCTIDITDNDGNSFIPSDGVIPSDVDHETIGGGRYHSPLPNPGPVYQNAIYYASQSVGEARALRSDNGGILFSPAAAPMFAITDCAGLHGHIKVSPADGTVYVPDFACGGSLPFHNAGQQAAIVSEDNGITWNVRPIPDSTTSGIIQEPVVPGTAQTRDPSVAIATDGTVYFAYQAANGHSMVAVSHDKGVTWAPSVDVGANVVNGGPVFNATFEAAVAGDPDRAAVTFMGTETGGNNWDCGTGNTCDYGPDFTGVWYLYIAVTYDGGQTWITQNVTPGDPVQRGGICGGGTCRNLLDFMDATIDKRGRILVGYDDGCTSVGCVAGSAPNDFTAKGYIARQSGGKRMLSAFDPIEPAVPGAPRLSGGLNQAGTTATLTWPVPDNGGSPITGYKVYRKVGASSFSLLAIVPTNTYADSTSAAGDIYHVTAVNGQGEGPYCNDVTPTVTVVETACKLPGILAVNDLNPDGTDNDSGANTPPDPRVNIRQLFVAEPFLGAGVEKLIFTMQLAPSTTGSPPASSQWYIIWQRQGTDPSDPNDANYDRLWVAMKTDATGALSFQYGKFGVPLDATNPNPQANTPTAFGNADTGTYDVASGLVTITISNFKLRAIDGGGSKYIAGTALGALNVRTYLLRPDAGQKSQNNANDITGDGGYTLVGNASCATNVPFLGAVSRKVHGTSGTFDIGLPATGPIGIECRTGGQNGNFTIVFVFANPIVSVANTSMTGTGSVSGRSTGTDPHEYVVNLTGVTNAQRLTLTLMGVTDTVGNNTPSVSATMGVLLGDVNGTGIVDGNDVATVQSQTRQPITGTTFRDDVNASGIIDGNDVSMTQGQTRTSLP